MLKAIKKSLAFPLIFLFISSLVFNACKNKVVRAQAIPEAVKTYVYAYTAGVISKNSPVRIRFAGAAITEDKIGSEADYVFDFNPSVSGTAVWEDDHTVRFDPKESWESGTAYVATVALKKVFDNLPKEAESFEFDFLIRDMGMGVEV